ncbi:MAG: ribonuclease H family protein [Nitriliruptoraceae bacterium]
MAELTCVDCGASFAPSPALLERFPGWTPSRCTRCHRAHRGGTSTASAATSSPPARAASRRPGGRPAAARQPARGGGEQHLTVAEVLTRYTDGPDEGVFTDGSAIPNPGPGGWGAVWVRRGEVLAQAHGHEPHTTNNRMELTAVAGALELVPPGTPVTIHTDSNLAVRTLTEWAAGWERRGWTRKTGPVENLDLVRPLFEALRERPEVELVWIKAHAGNRWNEYADALATAWARDEL